MNTDVEMDVALDAVTFGSEADCVTESTVLHSASSSDAELVFNLAIIISGCSCCKALSRLMSESSFRRADMIKHL